MHDLISASHSGASIYCTEKKKYLPLVVYTTNIHVAIITLNSDTEKALYQPMTFFHSAYGAMANVKVVNSRRRA